MKPIIGTIMLVILVLLGVIVFFVHKEADTERLAIYTAMYHEIQEDLPVIEPILKEGQALSKRDMEHSLASILSQRSRGSLIDFKKTINVNWIDGRWVGSVETPIGRTIVFDKSGIN